MPRLSKELMLHGIKHTAELRKQNCTSLAVKASRSAEA